MQSSAPIDGYAKHSPLHKGNPVTILNSKHVQITTYGYSSLKRNPYLNQSSDSKKELNSSLVAGLNHSSFVSSFSLLLSVCNSGFGEDGSSVKQCKELNNLIIIISILQWFFSWSTYIIIEYIITPIYVLQ